MSPTPRALADTAIALLGSPFRLHGRDQATGLDCVGLVIVTLSSTGAHPLIPKGYGLRNVDIEHWLPMATASGLVTAGGPVREGDILLVALGHCQHHLVIAVDEQTVIHAHAGLRRVVRQPLDPDWRIRAHWRLPPNLEG